MERKLGFAGDIRLVGGRQNGREIIERRGRRPNRKVTVRTSTRAVVEVESDQSASSVIVEEDAAWNGLKSILPYDVLKTIAKPGRYLGNERGAVMKDWDSNEVRMCLAYPETYEIGMSNTGHVILYSCVNDVDSVLCDRSYLPGPDMATALKDAGKTLFAVESKKELAQFDVLAIPVHYEMGATNCLELMSLSGIPITSEERSRSDTGKFDLSNGSFPLIFGGGQTVTANPEPFADFFDFFALGDGEEVLPAIAEKVKECKRQGLSRMEILLKLTQDVPGIYVPQFYTRHDDGAVRRNRDDVPMRPVRQVATPQPERALKLIPYVNTIHDRLTVEIRRGCTRGCRFCLPGNLNRPARDVEPDRVISSVVDGVKNSGYREFSLLSLSCSDWLSLPAVGIELKNKLREYNTNINLTLPSQRVDRFDENIAVLVAGGEDKRSGITFAPEAGTQRMRDVVNKGLTNEELLRGVKTAYLQGYAQVKLYFMIGLPGETDDDVLGIAETVKWLQRECKEKGRARLAVKLTISNFTPKPHTPFQWHSVSTEEFLRKQRLLAGCFKGIRDIKYNFTDVRISAMEDFIGRADRRLSAVIQKAWENGASMDDWWMDLDGAYNGWKKAIDDCGLSWEYRKTEHGEWNVMETPKEDVKGKRGWYNMAREQGLDFRTLTPRSGWTEADTETETGEQSSSELSPLERPLPWDHINSGVDKGWLRDELMKALTEALTPDCAYDECSSCGVCGDSFGNNVTITPPPIPEFKGHYRPAWTREQRLRARFSRRGAMAMLSHLDVNRMMDRAMLRAGLPISFSNGFNQQPRVQPAQPLPLGFTSDAEVYDFELATPVDPSEFVQKMSEQLPPSFTILDVSEVPLKSSSPSGSLKEIEWVVALVPASEESNPDWTVAAESVLQSGPILVEKVSKRSKKARMIDLREPLLKVEMASADDAEPILMHVGVDQWDDRCALFKYRAETSYELPNLSPSEFCRMVGMILDSDIVVKHAHKVDVLLQEPVKPKKEEKAEVAVLDSSDVSVPSEV